MKLRLTLKAAFYDAMIKIATKEMGRSDLAEYFRSRLA
jgi:hypothetical protein